MSPTRALEVASAQLAAYIDFHPGIPCSFDFDHDGHFAPFSAILGSDDDFNVRTTLIPLNSDFSMDDRAVRATQFLM
jgi:hypothetical protein